MPTNRHRIQVTETPEIEHFIDLAAREWPGESRSKLLHRVIHLGGSIMEEKREDAVRRRIEAIEATSGKYPEFGENYLAELRKDWPE